MILIKGDDAVPFAGGIQHKSPDGESTDCGLTKQPGDLVFGEGEMHAVWTVSCVHCFADALTTV